ncbi:hypothetical protein AB0L13_37090, partial [Saccharopolyspora shandongensis]|uniref:hypothetical protein n=1 Tax=Saccharopolyspora shandongensis TaxID=418495 RepID=UPI003434B3F5
RQALHKRKGKLPIKRQKLPFCTLETYVTKSGTSSPLSVGKEAAVGDDVKKWLKSNLLCRPIWLTGNCDRCCSKLHAAPAGRELREW